MSREEYSCIPMYKYTYIQVYGYKRLGCDVLDWWTADRRLSENEPPKRTLDQAGSFATLALFLAKLRSENLAEKALARFPSFSRSAALNSARSWWSLDSVLVISTSNGADTGWA